MTSPTSLFLVRHGEVEERYHRIFGGRIDMDLSPRGHDQVAMLAKYLRQRPLAAVYSSPMKRAQQTLAPLASHAGSAPVLLDGLREVDFGDWTGLGWEEVRERYGVGASEWLDLLDRTAIPNAEGVSLFRGRVEACVERMIQDHPGQSVAVVCHGGVVRMILSILMGLPLAKMAVFEIDYASVTHVDHFSNRIEVQLLNFTPWRDLP
jgi:broad specificity phosphatase PhoE